MVAAAAAALRSIPQTSRSGVRVSWGLNWLHQHRPRPSISSGSQMSLRKFLYHTDKQCLAPCFLTVRVPCGLETGYPGLAHGSRWGHRPVSYFPGSVYSIHRLGNFCSNCPSISSSLSRGLSFCLLQPFSFAVLEYVPLIAHILGLHLPQ